MNRTISSAAALLMVLAALIVVGPRPFSNGVDGAEPVDAAGQAQSDPSHNHTVTATQVERPAAAAVSPLLGNLGDHTHAVTTSSALAQRYFDEGLILTYGFNHAEAIRSFKDAITLDPACAMCYWGIANALGPNINAAMDRAAVPVAYEALQQALALAPRATAVEQAYIRALATRYSAEPVEDRSSLDRAYADAMRELARRYPDDADAATLFAESLMDLTPWNFFTKDGQATEYTDEIVATLESVLARNPRHPGANHFYIHAVEASFTPERALPSAERLETLVPGAGHLVHMPSHVYWRVGRYADAARINEHAIHADERSFGTRNADVNSHSFYALAYYPHNIHFLFAATQMQGRSAAALESARKLVANIPDEAYGEIPALEDFRPMPLFALVRFGRYDEILREPQPPAEMQYTTGVWHWARGLAYLRQGKLPQARSEYERLETIAQSEAMEKLTLASFPSAATLLRIAAHVLGAELAGATGDPEAMIARLEAAVAIQDGLPYIEPPSWFYPVRQSLGAALLAAGRVAADDAVYREDLLVVRSLRRAQEFTARAEAVYREDLRQYPNNGWSLFGLAQALRAQGRNDEAATVEKRFEEAWRSADVTLMASRF